MQRLESDLGFSLFDRSGHQPFVRYGRASFGGRQVERFLRAAHLTVNEVCEFDELDAIVRLVAAGLGVALVPEKSTQRRWLVAVRAIDHPKACRVAVVPKLLHSTRDCVAIGRSTSAC